MDHVAILKKSKIKSGDNLLTEIINGRKTIESRWYVNKIAPWNKIKDGEIVYFKEAGSKVSASAVVRDVLQYENLDQNTITEIIRKYGFEIAPSATMAELNHWGAGLSSKKYCVLVFLQNAKAITPFFINKAGFGISSAWLCVDNIDSLKINH